MNRFYYDTPQDGGMFKIYDRDFSNAEPIARAARREHAELIVDSLIAWNNLDDGRSTLGAEACFGVSKIPPGTIIKP